jgi:hypothetical protein
MTDAKQYLRQLTRMDERINALMERREHYQSMACRGTSSYTAERVSGTGQRSRVEDYAILLIDLESEIDRATDAYVDAKREAVALIECLHDCRFRKLLRWRYVCGWDWEQVRCGLGYDTVQAAHNLHSAALIEFQNVFNFYGTKRLDG